MSIHDAEKTFELQCKLTLVMILLKQLGIINVSWLVVTAPIWGGILVLLSLAVTLLIAQLVICIKEK